MLFAIVSPSRNLSSNQPGPGMAVSGGEVWVVGVACVNRRVGVAGFACVPGARWVDPVCLQRIRTGLTGGEVFDAARHERALGGCVHRSEPGQRSLEIVGEQRAASDHLVLGSLLEELVLADAFALGDLAHQPRI